MDHNLYDEEDEPLTTAGAASRALVPATRHDGFTPKRRRRFIKTLRRTGCVRDACRVAGISDSAAYKARRRDAEFRAQWRNALSKAGGDMETLAWQRAVEGIEEEVIAYGKVVGTRRRYDAQLFRMMLQASNPNKYGGQGLGTRKAMEKKIRAEIEEENRMLEVGDQEKQELVQRLMRKIDAVRRRMIREGKRYEGEDGELVPVGYVKAPPAEDATSTDEDEIGAFADDSGADWTDPEPVSNSRDGGAADEKSSISAENRRWEPRIRTFDGP